MHLTSERVNEIVTKIILVMETTNMVDEMLKSTMTFYTIRC